MQFKSKSYRVFRVINGIVLTILTLICLLPLLHVLALSLSDAVAANSNSVHFFPKGLNFSAYKLIFSNHAFLHAFGVSVLRTVTGCGLALAMVILTAYPLSLQDKDLKGRKVITWYSRMVSNSGRQQCLTSGKGPDRAVWPASPPSCRR